MSLGFEKAYDGEGLSSLPSNKIVMELEALLTAGLNRICP